jgi:Ca-activated chloride channel family protein
VVVSSSLTTLVLFLALGLPSLWAPGPEANRKGTEALRRGDAAKAAAEYQKAVEALPADRRALFNRGTALLAAGQLDAGLSSLISAAGDPGREIRSASFYNTGSGLFGAQKLKEALDAYKQAILADPNDQAAKFNYELTKRKLEQQEDEQQDQQQQQQNQDQQNEQNQQQNQEQQNQDQAQQQEQQQNQQDQAQNQEQQQPRPEDSQEEQQARPVAQMSKEQAEQLLDALQQSEKDMIKARMTSRRKRDVEKDW